MPEEGLSPTPSPSDIRLARTASEKRHMVVRWHAGHPFGSELQTMCDLGPVTQCATIILDWLKVES